MEQRFNEKVLEMAKILAAKKAEDVAVLHIENMTIIADYFVIASGRSTTHVKSLCDELEEDLGKKGISARRKEGYNEARWIVLDFSDILVHIFHREEREFYNIERLWSDGDNLLKYQLETT